MPTQHQTDERIQARHGIAELTRRAYRGQDLAPVATRIKSTLSGTKTDAAALMDLSAIEQLGGNLSAGLDYQSLALVDCQIYETISKNRPNLALLILAAPIHMGGNTPVDFLLAHSSIRQMTLFITPGTRLPDPLPAHDVTIVAAPGDSDDTRHFLKEIERETASWPTPIVNRPDAIARLERDQLCNLVSTDEHTMIPVSIRIDRQSLLNSATQMGLEYGVSELNWPLLIRPLGSHAGQNLVRVTSVVELPSYTSTCLDDEFFVTRFIDYRSDDGLFRKYRIVFVDGEPFPCHMAISDQWSIWYLNADMQENPAKRHEEQAFMDDFASSFAKRHATAFSALVSKINLDYFGIDCAEDCDGRLVVFEADNAMIVHDMDPPDVFPYKQRHMQAIFDAFEQMLYAKAKH